MRHKWLAVPLLVSLPVTGAAETPLEAFECRLPYRASLQSAATLPVLGQSETAATRYGQYETPASSRVDFDPSSLRVLGRVPSKAFLTMAEPSRGEQEATVTLTTYLPSSPELTKELRAYIPGCLMDDRVGCHGKKVEGRGQIIAKPQGPVTWVECRFKVREADLG